jgi:hypothetical protein
MRCSPLLQHHSSTFLPPTSPCVSAVYFTSTQIPRTPPLMWSRFDRLGPAGPWPPLCRSGQRPFWPGGPLALRHKVTVFACPGTAIMSGLLAAILNRGSFRLMPAKPPLSLFLSPTPPLAPTLLPMASGPVRTVGTGGASVSPPPLSGWGKACLVRWPLPPNPTSYFTLK